MISQTIQRIDGFQKAITGTERATLDYRGKVRGWEVVYKSIEETASGSAHEKESKISSIEWETAICSEKLDTEVSFVASSYYLSTTLANPPKAKLSVNGKDVLTFELGVAYRGRNDFTFKWEQGDFALELMPRRVLVPFEGYHRNWNPQGTSAIYKLLIPSRYIKIGKEILLTIQLLPSGTDTLVWFRIHERQNVLIEDHESLTDQVIMLQQDNIRLKQMVNTLARKFYADHFPDELDRKHVTIFTNGLKALIPADLVRLKNGELILSYRQGTEHSGQIEKTGQIFFIRSVDDGETWSHPTLAASAPGIDYRDPSVSELENSALLLSWFRWECNSQENRPSKDTQVLLKRSVDGGITWSEELQIDPTPFIWLITTEKSVELPDGKILMPVHGGTIEKQAVAACFCSDDGGITWRYLSTLPYHESKLNLDQFSLETSFTVTHSGRIVAVTRTRKGMYQAASSDEGKTWGTHSWLSVPPQKLPAPLTQPNLLTLSDGRLLLCYGDRGPYVKPRAEQAPYNIIGHLSDDEGMSWGDPIVLRDDIPHWDMGYPTSVELRSGRIFTIYWYTMFHRYYLAGTYWNVPQREVR